MPTAEDLAAITWDVKVFARVDGRVVAGTVQGTMHVGSTLTEVVVFSPELGHTNRIDHGVSVAVEDIVAVGHEPAGYLVASSAGYIHGRYLAGAR